MAKNGLKTLTENANSLSESEIKDLEKLTTIFGKFNSIFIDGGFVYGHNDSPKRKFLGTKEDYYKYRKLKQKKSSKNKKSYHKREFIPETYNNFNL